ncbi:MAG: Mrp/NBP35 family ATP-binding protein [Cryobacterium sp.]|uniref:Mrp/NBP35 family ATP-binding protein n=1 Tax=unclassified Cryobacterium TaxID=2649013 RepID=UPI0018CBA865|nr:MULTISPECIES: Mrp/NBP35 family ATP-binding protein [unclassified Cryobacterium]MCY7403184.1 Mrp/NBP35 family ATP-binding protein [Cryobacterium sp.]MEC5152986.1 ATP-binding protein involved in chromosome partitioning [Cryobacterium sp. CAN_C3]
MSPAPLTDSIRSRVFTALAGVTDPEIRKPITDLDMVSGVTVTETGQVTVGIRLTIAGCPAAQRIESDVLAAAESVSGAGRASVEVAIMTREQRTALTEKLRGGQVERSVQFGPESLTRVYAITSGKGGVGKSTVTANLAVALAGEGLRVGIVDADVHGFSIPGLLGLVHDGLAVKPTQVGDMILPPIAHDVKIISIGMFIDDASAAVAWRGPMLHRTIKQFLTDVYFGDLDVLLLDLPPGTGDVAITVGQLLPHAEVIVVTTPQAAAADVAERSGIVARQTGQSVYGVIENMSAMVQPDGSLLELFGSGGGAEVARRLSLGQPVPVPVLAQVPLSVPLRTGGDAGLPVVLGAPDDPAARAILRLAHSMKTRARGLAGLSLGLRPR